MTEALLSLSNVETHYGPVPAVRGVSLEVPDSAIVAVLGANGAGKTTVLKTISGVMTPEKGTVRYRGAEIQSRPPDRVVRLGIAHVPEGREVFPYLTVRENLSMGAWTRTDRGGVEDDLNAVCAYFPVLRARRDQEAARLSGGEQQMLAIARALMTRPRLLLLDEPSLGLSPILVGEIFAIIRRVNEERGTAILLVEQNAKMALDIAAYGYVLEAGRVVMEDSAARLREKDDIKEFYLGMTEPDARGARRRKRKKRWR